MTTVLIITYKAAEELHNCLASLHNQTHTDFSISVVYTGNRPTGIGEHINLYKSPVNGYSFAVNVGISNHPDDDIILLNDDTIATSNFVEELVANAPSPGIYQPQICLAANSGIVENCGHWVHPDGFNFARGRGQTTDTPLPNSLLCFSGAAVYIHREVIRQVGPFDEDLGFFGEDLDWSLRAIRLGYPIRYVPSAKISHILGASYGRANKEKAYLVEKNRIQAIIRSFPKRDLSILPFWLAMRLLKQGIGSVLGLGVAGFDGNEMLRGAIKGNIAGTMSIPNALQKRISDARHWKQTSAEFRRQLYGQLPPLRDIWHPKLR